jgi:conjugative transfer signal peptidase TraF
MELASGSSLTWRCLRRLAFVLLGTVAAIIVASIAGGRFVWNLSPSLRRGLYVLDRSAAPTRDAIVTFQPPANAAALIAARHYLPHGVSLLKTVVALPGDAVCIDDVAFLVSGRIVGLIARHDSAGRPLDSFRFCSVVSPGSAFVSTAAPLSFDSRYFGPVPLSNLTVAVPVWTY